MILDERDESPRLLSYCTNVHPGETVDEIVSQLTQHALPLRKRFADQELFGLGLRLGAVAVEELDGDPQLLDRLRGFLAEHGLAPFTLNAFPQGTFHQEIVKEAVYEPDWTQQERFDYTAKACRLLAALLPPALDFGTVSTLPLGFGAFDEARRAACARQLLRMVSELAALEAATGTRIQLCLEPEPCCEIETTPQLIFFFEQELLPGSAALETVDGRNGEELLRRHLGACYDACHQAVVFEEASYNLERFRRAGIQVGKIQLSSALELRRPAENPDGLERLQSFQEPRFLHQVVTRSREGALERFLDLDRYFAAHEAGATGDVDTVRCHFHVPIHRPDAYPLGTTQQQLREVLNRQRSLREVLHLEVETYTMDLLPGGPSGPSELVEELEGELRFAAALLR